MKNDKKVIKQQIKNLINDYQNIDKTNENRQEVEYFQQVLKSLEYHKLDKKSSKRIIITLICCFKSLERIKDMKEIADKFDKNAKNILTDMSWMFNQDVENLIDCYQILKAM